VNPGLFRLPVFLFFVLATSLSPAAFAHHSTLVTNDRSNSVTLAGKVIQLRLINPHIKLYVEVTNDKGNKEEWMIEGPGKQAVVSRGWTNDTFKSGEQITVMGWPDRTGDKSLLFTRIIKEDGTELLEPSYADKLAIQAQTGVGK